MKTTKTTEDDSQPDSPPTKSIPSSTAPISTSEEVNHAAHFDENEHNENWDTDPDSVTYCYNWDDVERRESYTTGPDDDEDMMSPVKTFSFGFYGTLRTVLREGRVWTPVRDVGLITGVPLHSITGWLYNRDKPVRRGSGFLEPNHIRCLVADGIDEVSIPLEAAIPTFAKKRGGRLKDYFVKQVIPGAYSFEPEGAVTCHPSFLDPVTNTAGHSARIPQHRYHGDFHGELRAIILGTQAWINLTDVVGFSHLKPAWISEIAGKSRLVSIPDSGLSNPDNPKGTQVYVLFDAVSKLLRAIERGRDLARELENWVNHDLMSESAQLKSGRYVKLSTLHQMLGKHVDFTVWLSRLFHTHLVLLTRVWGDPRRGSATDPNILLTEAYAIAKAEEDPAAMIPCILIREGGYFHKGALGETVEATLKRFQGLVPDRSRRVEARKVHEFTNATATFEDWVKTEELKQPQGITSITLHSKLMTLDEAEDRGLWTNNSFPYPEWFAGFEAP